jgi:MYND finger
MSPEMTGKLKEAAKLPQAVNKVALQIVAVQLRAWIVDQDDVVCRPYYIACLELYPRGKVLHAHIHSPASKKPDAAALVHFLLDHLLNPPKGEPRERPTHVSFIDEDVVKDCGAVMAKLRLEGGHLTLADGVTDYVRMFSDKLVKMERASRGDTSEHPGILSVSGVTVKAGMDLMTRAVEMYRAAPWKRIDECIALEATVPASASSKARKSRFYISVLGSGGKVVGFAVMASLDALRAKYRRSKEGVLAKLNLDDDDDDEDADSNEGKTISGSPVAASGELLCAACGCRVGEEVESDGCRYVHRCGGCRRLLYCDEQCQQLDWGQRHNNECETAAADKEFIFHRDEWTWLRRELALLFVDPTSVPFDDLDAANEHGWPHIENASPPLHPMAFVTIEGNGDPSQRRVDRPTADEVRVMTCLATALTACAAAPPGNGEVLLPNGVVLRVAEDLKVVLC